MADALNNIDVSHLDALARLEADQKAVRALIEKAAWHRDKVVEVYSRVVGDYEARFKALDDQAQAVRQHVRKDLEALDELHEQCREAVDQARIELQESEFRHEIGEFSREDFQERQQATERTIAERQAEFESVKKLRQRYLELLPGAPAVPAAAASRRAAPASAAPAPPAPEAVVVAPPPVVPPPPPAAAAPAAAAVPPVPAPPPAAEPEEEGATSFLPPPSSTEFQLPSAPAGGDAEQFGTVAVAAAMLIEDKAGLPGAAHRLGLQTSIGRTPDNQVVVPAREVSRRHAEILISEGGYVLKDLGSPNGTFVNGERITEHKLADGDRIAMGGQVFVFKAR
jgi:hypothetical protein